MGFQYISISVYIVRSHARIQRGDRGSGPPPLKNHKNIQLLSNTGPDPLEFSKLPSQHSTSGHHRHASETPFKGYSLAGRWWPAFSDIWILSPLKKKNNSDPDQIRMEFMKECFVNLNIWPCDRKHAIEYPTLSCKSRCAREASPSRCMIFFEITRD